MICAFNNKHPNIHDSVFIAKSAQVIGQVSIGKSSSVWFNSVVRGDVNYIEIGQRTNIQDNSVLHVTKNTYPLVIGNNVTIGHRVVVHGCSIEDNTLIGIGSVLLDGSVVNSNSIVAAGSLVPPGFNIPSGVLAVGSPVKIKRDLNEQELTLIDKLSNNYVEYSLQYLSQDF
ncbi:MAG TPA: gamma carbonic anhydrase family protein [Thermodesulfobacteriota bacterium]|nr:gamma carbonic anhydrase family protein [Thermodesulfobacteriota bacterium]